jgi:hypothetical protein
MRHGRVLRRQPEAVQRIVEEQPGQGERRESATDVRLDGDEMPADADDGDAGHYSGTYMVACGVSVRP